MKVKGMIESDVDTFKVGDVIEVKLADGVKVQAMAVQQEEDGMVFCLVDCLPSEHPMNSTSTNEGGYEESDLRKKLNTECLNLAKSIDAIMLCYNPDIDALKAENLSDMAVRLLDGVSRRGVVKDLEDFRDKWRHYNEQAAAESQVILDKISELFEKDGDSK